jgi:hypothetical protein
MIYPNLKNQFLTKNEECRKKTIPGYQTFKQHHNIWLDDEFLHPFMSTQFSVCGYFVNRKVTKYFHWNLNKTI